MGDSLWLVIDAPYVQLKVWPLTLHDGGEAGKHATIDLSQWQMQARSLMCVEEHADVSFGFLYKLLFQVWIPGYDNFISHWF